MPQAEARWERTKGEKGGNPGLCPMFLFSCPTRFSWGELWQPYLQSIIRHKPPWAPLSALPHSKEKKKSDLPSLIQWSLLLSEMDKRGHSACSPTWYKSKILTLPYILSGTSLLLPQSEWWSHKVFYTTKKQASTKWYRLGSTYMGTEWQFNSLRFEWVNRQGDLSIHQSAGHIFATLNHIIWLIPIPDE